jgi:formylglycine-generating enzyme required for sulfatase activity
MRHRLTARGFCLLATAILLTNATERAPAQASRPAIPARLTLQVDDVTFDFVRIDPGRFTMGSPHRHVDEYNWTYEMPAHEVTIRRAYYMGVTEVTVEQFRLFVEQTGYVTDAQKQGCVFSPADTGWRFEYLVDWRWPGYAQTDREPVVCLDWHDAQAFCRWLGEKTGRNIRLPSEAEWEYACRAGTTGEHAGKLDAMGWYAWNSGGRTHPVAQKQPNAWGLYDMHGNVWEWVQDHYHRDCAGAPTDGSAWLDTTDVDPRGITRGGSFFNPAWLCRSYIRMQTPLGQKVHTNNGFRLVLAIESEVYGKPIPNEPTCVPLHIDLPKRRFLSYAPQSKVIPRFKPYVFSRRLMVPHGVTNVALSKPILSQADPVTGSLAMITDGHKDGGHELRVELPPGLQTVTIDLETTHTIYGVQTWHTVDNTPAVYHDVIVQVSDDLDFISNVHTIFNNDMDNSAGCGVGWDWHYPESYVGLLIDAGGIRGRYIRLFSNGSSVGKSNHYVEVEVYGQLLEQTPTLIPLNICYPRPMFISHRSPDFMNRVPNVEKPVSEPPPPLMVPPGTRNVALGKPVTSSGDMPIIGHVEMITDGRKETEPFVEWEPGLSHVTIDLEGQHAIHAIAFWHYHVVPRIYFDVIVQISKDPEFRTGVITVFNNDHDNSAGMGIGRDKHYVETCWGKVIPVDSVRGRYVRLYSNGNDQNELNQYLEV